MLRHAAFAPPGATGQRAPGRALCTPGLATSLPAAGAVPSLTHLSLTDRSRFAPAQRDLSPRPCGSSWTYSFAQRCDVAVSQRVWDRGKPEGIFYLRQGIFSLFAVFQGQIVNIPFALLSGMLPGPRRGRPGKGRLAAPSALRALRQACPPLARYLRSLICP